jgi:hypothetical protein
LRHYFSILVAIAMIFNGTIAVIGSAWAVNNAQKYATDDAMMICTGSQFKWISTEDYFSTGEMVFIDPPTDAPKNIDNLNCSFLYIAEQYIHKDVLPVLPDRNIAYQALTRAIAQRPYTAFAYSTAQTRAPPIV